MHHSAMPFQFSKAKKKGAKALRQNDNNAQKQHGGNTTPGSKFACPSLLDRMFDGMFDGTFDGMFDGQ